MRKHNDTKIISTHCFCCTHLVNAERGCAPIYYVLPPLFILPQSHIMTLYLCTLYLPGYVIFSPYVLYFMLLFLLLFACCQALHVFIFSVIFCLCACVSSILSFFALMCRAFSVILVPITYTAESIGKLSKHSGKEYSFNISVFLPIRIL